MLLLLHPLGLGDHIMYNGLVRHFSEIDDVILFVWERYFKEVSYMYRDTNIKFCRLFIETSEEVDYNVNNLKYDKFIPIGPHTINGIKYNDNQEIIPFYDNYTSINIDYNLRYTNFFVDHDEFMENFVYNLFTQMIGNKKYIIVHDDPNRNLIIDFSKIPEKDFHIFTISNNRNNFTPHFNMFHMYKIIKNAEAFHGYEGTGWSILIEQWRLTNLKKYIHVYTRRKCAESGGPNDNFREIHYTTHNWNFIY
jgi:hypothetical protein